MPRSIKSRHHRSYYAVTVHGQGKDGSWATERFILNRSGTATGTMVNGNLSNTGRKMFKAKHPDMTAKKTYETGPKTRKELIKEERYAQAYTKAAEDANPWYSASLPSYYSGKNVSSWRVEPIEVTRSRSARRAMRKTRKGKL